MPSFRSRARGARQLIDLLQGKVVRNPDWSSILSLANAELVTPRLSQLREPLPRDVVRFVEETGKRVWQRNVMLLEQLSFAATLLNAVDIVPLVIKGGACLVRQGASAPRILSDLDLVVAPDEACRAVECLVAAGFSVAMRFKSKASHVVATLERPQDAGQIDLHRRPPGPPSFLSFSLDESQVETLSLGEATLRIPTPHMHIYFQAMHDQLHDRAYWRGGMDLRHAWDLADLIAAEPIDWVALRQATPTQHITNVIGSELSSCHLLTGARIPAAYLSASARVRALVHIVQYLIPSLRSAMAVVMLGIELPTLLQSRKAERSSREKLGLPARASNGLQNLLQIIRPRK